MLSYKEFFFQKNNFLHCLINFPIPGPKGLNNLEHQRKRTHEMNATEQKFDTFLFIYLFIYITYIILFLLDIEWWVLQDSYFFYCFSTPAKNEERTNKTLYGSCFFIKIKKITIGKVQFILSEIDIS